MRRRALLASALAATLAGCATRPAGEDAVKPRELRLRDLAKGDLDLVAEIHYREAHRAMRELMLKLYRRNPQQWRRAGKPSAEFAVERVFRARRVPDFVELGGRRGTDAIRIAFEPAFAGDRVLAFVAGLAAMVQRAYGERSEFYLFDQIDPQRLYNSARNVEIAAWLLATSAGAGGRPLLLSNSMPGEPRNLSFERLFGRLISVQDTLAQVVAGSTGRTIRKLLQRIAGAAFLPI